MAAPRNNASIASRGCALPRTGDDVAIGPLTMFTGIVETLGHLAAVRTRDGVRIFDIAAPAIADGIAVGDSVSVNGACLTAVAADPDGFTVELVPETLAKTALGTLAVGDAVNLERSVTPSTRLGGHIVQGHVEAVGEVVALEDEGGGARRVRVRAPDDILRYVVRKGFIAVDGASLTVVDVDATTFSIAFIPHTLAVTVAGGYHVGTHVQLESDILGRYVERLLGAGVAQPGQLPPIEQQPIEPQSIEPQSTREDPQ